MAQYTVTFPDGPIVAQLANAARDELKFRGLPVPEADPEAITRAFLAYLGQRMVDSTVMNATTEAMAQVEAARQAAKDAVGQLAGAVTVEIQN